MDNTTTNTETPVSTTTTTAIEPTMSIDAVINETPVNDFEEFGLSPETFRSIQKLKYQSATPIQKTCIPYLLDNESDIIALAKTGTGKTAAFGIPLVEKITPQNGLQALVLCPTRELAQQVSLNIKNFGLEKKINVATVLGGESYERQIRAIKSKPEVLVSTPGRLIDLLEQKLVNLSEVQYFILDEADEMLSFGFQEALETIWRELEKKNSENTARTWLFSATMSTSIRKLAQKYLNSPHEVKLNTKEEKINVKAFATVVYEEDKEDALSLLIKNEEDFYGIIFATTKKQVAELELRLRNLGLDVDSLHGDKVQAERTRTINRMKSRQTKILVATDVAARGLDIQDLTHVVNFEIPWDVETFTHRIGRTARAGKTGVVWTFVKPKESHHLKKFERALGIDFENLLIPKVEDVQVFQKVKWMKQIAEMPFRETDFVKFEKALDRMENEKVQNLSLETRQWLVRALQYFGQSEELRVKQPRTLELRKSDDRFGGGGGSGYSRDGGGRSGGGRGGFRGGSRGGSRSESGGGRGGYRGGRRDGGGYSAGGYEGGGRSSEGSRFDGSRSEGSRFGNSEGSRFEGGRDGGRSEGRSEGRGERTFSRRRDEGGSFSEGRGGESRAKAWSKSPFKKKRDN